MSLPNDDDDNDENRRRQKNNHHPWRSSPYGEGCGEGDDDEGVDGIYPDKKHASSSQQPSSSPLNNSLDENDESGGDDDRTTAATSVGSMMSFTASGSIMRPSSSQSALHLNAPNTLTTHTQTSAATVAPLTVNNNSVMNTNTVNTYDNELLVREHKRRQLQRLGIASGISFSLVIYLLIPTALLLSMILFGILSVTLIYNFLIYGQNELQTIVRGHGIGTLLLPTGIMETLTQTSIHDFLTDPTGFLYSVNEHIPYLLMYMIPGLSEEQLNGYVHRLSLNHQQLLRNEHGLLGYFIHTRNNSNNSGNNNNNSLILRFLMGDEGLREQQQQQDQLHDQSQQTIIMAGGNSNRRIMDRVGVLVSPPTTISEGISVSPSELGNDDDPTTITSPSSPSQFQSVPSIPPPMAVVRRQSSTRRVAEEEEVVLFDAIGTAVSNYLNIASTSIRSSVRESTTNVLYGPIFRGSIGVTALGLSIGSYGLFISGTYTITPFLQPTIHLIQNTFTSLLSIVIGNGGGRSTANGSSGSGSGGGSSSSSNSIGSIIGMMMPSSALLIGTTSVSFTTAVVLGLFSTSSPSTDSTTDSTSNTTTQSSKVKNTDTK